MGRPPLLCESCFAKRLGVHPRPLSRRPGVSEASSSSILGGPDSMLDVFFTVDVEIWCDGWDDLDRKFPSAYQRYVYGPTRDGDYALPATLKILNDHGLRG